MSKSKLMILSVSLLTLCSTGLATARPIACPPQKVPSELNGRKIDIYWQRSDQRVGYSQPQYDLVLVQHPKLSPVPRAPLYVVLHSAGHDVLRCIKCTTTPGNHDIYHAPKDFYALYLDCRAHQSIDWWRGYALKKGFDCSPCEQRVMDTVRWAIRNYPIDRERVYLCGNSMGGSGTLGIGMRNGDIFAAIKANVPAGVDHVLDRLGVSTNDPRAKRLPEPPFLVDYSAPNDKWSTGHERLAQIMREKRFGWFFYWGKFGHENDNQKILTKNDLVHSFDWLSLRLHAPYPVFTHASSDTNLPWPQNCQTEKPGQINGFFRWSDIQETKDSLQITLFLLPQTATKHFTIPAKVQTDLTFRRLQKFHPQAGQKFRWKMGKQNGSITIGQEIRPSISGLQISQEKQTLKIYQE